MTRVLLVDDHQLVRAGIAGLLATSDGVDVVGEAASGEESVDLVARCAPDVVLMDLSMPGIGGVEATRRIRAAQPEARVLVLTSFADHDRVGDALGAGAVGYLLKDCDPRDLVAAIRAAARGHVPIDPRVAGALLPAEERAPATVRSGTDTHVLSAREREVLDLVGRGLANKQIARQLGISESTVKAHVGNIFRTIGVNDRTSAALWARSNLAVAARD